MYEPVNTYESGTVTMDDARQQARDLVEPKPLSYELGARDGHGRGVGMPGGGRRNRNDEPCDIDDEMGSGYGQGGGRGGGRGR